MVKYNHSKIEKKWQKTWEKKSFYKAKDFSKKPKFYILIEFPYPSGEGLHVGHIRSYSALDAVARKKRMEGFNVLYPIGWDAFGLPAENYAIKTGIHPSITVKRNISNFKHQMKSMGLSFDWSREINTTDPGYYKWTQWIFLKLFENGLAYKKKMPINWCPSCKTGLANEEVVAGKCERCGAPVEQKEKEQWIIKITKYADRLAEDLDKVDYLKKIKSQQINWIGKSYGVEVDFKLNNSKKRITVFTTRLDTIFGITAVVLSPDNPLVPEIILKEKEAEVREYIKQSKLKNEFERTKLEKEKTGVFTGSYCINPANNEKVPIWIGDYVVASYGGGAVMMVPAHDNRDYEFAKKYNLPIKQVIAPDLEDYKKTIKALGVLNEIYVLAKNKKIKFWLLGGLANIFHTGIIYRAHGDLDLVVKNIEDQNKFYKLLEEAGFKKIKEKKLTDKLTNFIYRNKDDVEVDIGPYVKEFGILDEDLKDDEKELEKVKCLVASIRYLKVLKEYWLKNRSEQKDKIDLEYLNGKTYIKYGFLVNSGEFDGLKSEEAIEKITQWLEQKKLGKKTIQYKLRDWVFSRQHYWGEPIPIIHCQKCGQIPVLEKDLPVKLPFVKKYQPTGTGESPLAAITSWINVRCPKCKGLAKRETDTMPNWAGSSWYFMRYTDPKNKKNLADPKKLKYWMSIDWYNGGMEHTTLHLLYSRFWYKFLYDIGISPQSEPYAKRTSHGVVLAEDGQKMSKSRGNVINPDDVIKKYGADTLRIYEMFMGPFDQMIFWDTHGIIGARRFLERMWNLVLFCKDNKKSSKDIQAAFNYLVKKISEDLDSAKFNTAIAAFMEFLNLASVKKEEFGKDIIKKILVLLAPFAPHIIEELWYSIGNKKSVHLEPWPKYDPEIIKEEKIILIIQINGKVRGKIEAESGVLEEKAKQLALSNDKIKKWLEGKKIKKIIFIPNKLINIVL